MSEQTRSTLSTVLLILFRALFTVFAVYTTWFIFSNSMEIGAISAGRSEEVRGAVNGLLEGLGLNTLSSRQIRKLAHFGEFAALGFWFMCCLRVYTRRYLRHISWPLLLGLGVACCDETIQLYTSGRDSSLPDVWLDFGGVVTGVLGALLALLVLGGLLYLMGFGRRQPA